MPDPEPMFLRPSEAAALAGLSTRAIYRAVQRGDLRAVRLCSRLRIPHDGFEEWIERSAVRPERPGVEVSRRGAGARELSPPTGRQRRRCAAMSVERVERKDGRVRWRQGEHNRSKVVGRKRDADASEAELRRRKRTGELAQLDAGKEPLSEFGEEWWRLYAEPNLAPWTLRTYAAHWDAHVLPRLGSIPLRELTSDVTRPYDLRHSFVSLLIAEGHNVVDVARQAGHSPKMALDTYAHVFEEIDPAERVDAADRIRKAREELRLSAMQPTLCDPIDVV